MNISFQIIFIWHVVIFNGIHDGFRGRAHEIKVLDFLETCIQMGRFVFVITVNDCNEFTNAV